MDEGAYSKGSLMIADVLAIINKIREANKENKDELAIQLTTGEGEEDQNLKLGGKDYTYLKMVTTGFNPLTGSQPIITIPSSAGSVTINTERPSYKLKPSELSKTNYTENGVKFVKYVFHELQTQQGVAPYANTVAPTGINRIEISVKENEQIAFENYLLGRDNPLPGDPLINMEIVGVVSSSRVGGTYGCVRWTRVEEDRNCKIWEENVANFPFVSGSNKVHDGIDLLAPLGTPVYAMFDGELTTDFDSNLGNFILIMSTQEQHKLNGVNEKIWISYGHLSSFKITNGKVKQGQLIGYTGNTGITASGIEAWRYHLHLTIYKGGTSRFFRTNPLPYLTTKFESNGDKIN